MATSYDLFFSGDHEAAKQSLGTAFEQLGFTVQTRPNNNWVAARGSAAKTFWLGAMAGKGFRVTFEITFFVDAAGALVARFNRNVAGGALRGGAIGANMANNAFNDTYNSLVQALGASGTLARSIANN
jgi:hypothetical protein